MDILGIGPLELLLILLIALVVLGPQEMSSSARKLAGFIRKATRSDTWKQMMATSREIRELPTRLVRESGFDEQINEIRRDAALSIDAPYEKPVNRGGPAEVTPAPPPAAAADAPGPDVNQQDREEHQETGGESLPD